jgi:hypothetical protein
LPICWPFFGIAPRGKFVVCRIRFDLGNSHCGVFIVKTPPCNKVSNDPATPIPIVVKVGEAIPSDKVRTGKNDAVVSTSAMVIVCLVCWHEEVSQTRLKITSVAVFAVLDKLVIAIWFSAGDHLSTSSSGNRLHPNQITAPPARLFARRPQEYDFAIKCQH